MKTYVIMLAGGRGNRMNADRNKVLLNICGKPVILRSIEAFSFIADEMVIVSRPDEREAVQNMTSSLSLSFPLIFADGGETRQQSVQNGLKAINPAPDDIILIHDAARCLVDRSLITCLAEAVIKFGAAVPGIPVTSTYKICDRDGYILMTPDRSSLYEAQTPQGFKAEKLYLAFEKASEEGVVCTDDASILEHYGIPVKVIHGSPANFKLTVPEDLSRAKSIIEGDELSVRVGMGYDVHRFVPDRKLVLCGVEIPFELGLLGHSDADVALHALIDAMLGACSLGDIGKHFPDTSESYRDISSLFLLKETDRLIRDAGFRVHNADITIVAQQPKLLPYIHHMSEMIASALSLPVTSVSVKATTTEKLGFEGRMEGISSYAVCTVVDR